MFKQSDREKSDSLSVVPDTYTFQHDLSTENDGMELNVSNTEDTNQGDTPNVSYDVQKSGFESQTTMLKQTESNKIQNEISKETANCMQVNEGHPWEAESKEEVSDDKSQVTVRRGYPVERFVLDNSTNQTDLLLHSQEEERQMISISVRPATELQLRKKINIPIVFQ